MWGVLLGMLARTDRHVLARDVISAAVPAALCGCRLRIEITLLWAQQPELRLPTASALDALHRLVSFGRPPTEIPRPFSLRAHGGGHPVGRGGRGGPVPDSFIRVRAAAGLGAVVHSVT